MALKTKQDVNNEQWQPLQDDWLTVTGIVCVCVCVCVCKREGGSEGNVCVPVIVKQMTCFLGYRFKAGLIYFFIMMKVIIIIIIIIIVIIIILLLPPIIIIIIITIILV